MTQTNSQKLAKAKYSKKMWESSPEYREKMMETSANWKKNNHEAYLKRRRELYLLKKDRKLQESINEDE
jgi:hypothetical protein